MHLMEKIDPAQAYRADGVTVIGIDKGQKGMFASSISLLPPKLKGDLNCNLNGGRTIVRCGNACATFHSKSTKK